MATNNTRDFYAYMYARKLLKDKTGLMIKEFEHRSSLYGRVWAEKIWKFRNEIKRGEK